MEQLSEADIAAGYQAALQQGLIDVDDTAVIFIDLAIISDRLARLKRAFPAGTLHAVAVKTNPLQAVLQHIVGEGMGLEAASLGEVMLANNAGVENTRLVFDSPAKTEAEIAWLVEHLPTIRINADSLAELARYEQHQHQFALGLRINPLVVPGTMAAMTVSSADSKFGVPVSEREAIIDACVNAAGLDCLHMHIGSQYSDLKPVVDAVRSLIELAEAINSKAGTQKITTLDIGGGFPVNYEDGPAYLIEDYASALQEACPELYEGRFQLVTEYGRYVHANAVWVASRVEYVKPKADGEILISHAGADMFLREAYSPGDWHHKLMLMDAEGNIKSGNSKDNTDIAGPLCFGGDFVSKGVNMPAAQPGDVIAIRDAGANTFALWSRHCSRPFPKVIAIENGKPRIMKQRETFEQIIDFWR